MREIKFRAWDGERMIYTGDKVYPSHFNSALKNVSEPVEVYHNTIQLWVLATQLSGAVETHFDYITTIPHKEMGQYTGLKDKNGKEIYEGDIVKVQPYTEEEYQVTVRYEDGGFVIPSSEWDEYDAALLGWYINFYGSHTIEVIGNIHENPELLEETA